MLFLVFLAPFLHQLYRLLPGKGEGLNGEVFLCDLLHFRFNAEQIFVGQFHVAQIHVIIKTLFRGGAVSEVCVGPKALDSLRHNVRRRVADHVELFLFGTLGNVAVVVQYFHDIFFLSVILRNKKHP